MLTITILLTCAGVLFLLAMLFGAIAYITRDDSDDTYVLFVVLTCICLFLSFSCVDSSIKRSDAMEKQEQKEQP